MATLYRTYQHNAATYAALAALSPTAGDTGYTQDYGYNWKYDGVNSTWRIVNCFRTTAATLNGLSTAGVRPGDFAFVTDSARMAFNVGVGLWSYIS